MEKIPPITEKFAYNGRLSLPRPDLKPPAEWSLELIASQERIRNHRLSPDGRKIAFIKDAGDLSEIYIMGSAGGWPGRVTFGRGPVAFWDDEIPQWSPDSGSLAFVTAGSVHVASAAGGLPVPIAEYIPSTSSPRWLPDSTGLIVSINRQEADQLALISLDGNSFRLLTDDADGDHWDARPSPDGSRVAFTIRRFDDLHRLDVYILDLKSGVIDTVYGKPGTRTHDPRWSPSGDWITFISQEAGHDDLWLLHPDGIGLRQVTHLGYDIVQYAWHPLENQLLLTINRGGACDLAILDPVSGQLTDLRVGNGLHSNPNWAPDGSFITFEYESPIAPPEIFRMELPSRQTHQLTFSMLPALAANQLTVPEKTSFGSYDGLEIPAFLYHPEKTNGAAIVILHGGPSAQVGFDWDPTAQYLAARGYTLLLPNYRGSTGYGVGYEHANYNNWGQADTQDCLHAARFLASLPWIDASRLAVMGSSYGAYLVNCCLARDPDHLYACGISKYGDADTLSSWALCKRELRLYTEIFLGHPSGNRAAYQQSSPIFDVKNVQSPVLLLHGLEDDIVPPQASEEWAAALRTHGKTYEYKTYSGEPHGFLHYATLLDSLTRIEKFLDWYLLPH